LTFGGSILLAFFLNDAIALVFTPLTLGLTQTLNLKPVPYLLAVAGATNIGSVANLIVVEAAATLEYRLSFGEHLRFGLPLTATTLGLTYLRIH
jgi:Na+/H+ antiporter NhaD/arsenite permease-like protein